MSLWVPTKYVLLSSSLGCRLLIIVPQVIVFTSHCPQVVTSFIVCLQKDDLKAVVEYLRTDVNVSLIGLWGRSMGAVTRFLSNSFIC